MNADALHAAVQAFIADHADFPKNVDHARFDALAVAIAQLQVATIPGQRRLFARHGVDVARITAAAEIPAVPTDVFKQTRVAAFPEALTVATFRTSGTTIGARGSHPFRTLATYEAGALAAGRQALLTSSSPVPVVVLGPSPLEVSDSSLGHMNALFAKHFGEVASDADTFFLRNDALQLDALTARIAALPPDGELLLLGTSFSYVHLLDGLAAAGHCRSGPAVSRDAVASKFAGVRERTGPSRGGRMPLPRRARVMQTGGFKGKSREVDGDELRRLLAETFAIDPRAIVHEYGMTELSSQCWEWTAVDPDAETGILHPPPWQRVIAVDPETLAPVAPGGVREGIARIVDLANVESAVVLQTQDRVIVREDGSFQLLGRLPGAPPRGCSIAIDEMLGG